MNQRHLVGMSNGAKKRAAWRKAQPKVLTRQEERCGIRLRRLSAAEIEERYQDARLRYRIGQRLRPCRGCADCDPDGHKVPFLPVEKWWAPCHGSGVVPC